MGHRTEGLKKGWGVEFSIGMRVREGRGKVFYLICLMAVEIERGEKEEQRVGWIGNGTTWWRNV